MPRIKMTKSNIDALPIGKSDIVYWDAGHPGFGVKVTPKGRKVFVVLYRTGGAGSRLRKYTIGPYGRVTLHQAQVAAQKVFTAKLEGRILRVRGGRLREGSLPIELMICWRPTLSSMFLKDARAGKYRVYCDERSVWRGTAGASTRSPNVMWSR